MESDGFLQVTQIIQDIGIWAVFLYLFVNERNAHTETRNHHMDDLREISGMRQKLQNAHE